MDISKDSFLTANEILSDVLKWVDDERYEINSSGFYISLVQQALEGLAFDTFFDTKQFDCPFPKDDLRLEMPIGSFNMKHIYIYNGASCDIRQAQKVWYKANYYRTGGKGQYFADNRATGSRDPFFPNHGVHDREIHLHNPMNIPRPGNLDHTYFYNIQNGIIVFSSVCRNFEKVHLEFNGTGCDIGEVPIIPQFLREAVQDFVAESTLRIRMAKDSRAWSSLWSVYAKRLNRDQEYGIATGSWYRAGYRVRNMSASKRADLLEYFGSSQWQKGL